MLQIAVPSAKSKAHYHVGVLFVHGIGQQVQGETLTKFSDALSAWLARWVTRNNECEASIGPENDHAPVVISATDLEPADGSPAHASMRVNGRLDKALPEGQNWLLAESWWAETFKAPKTGAVLRWMLTILPYMVLEQFLAPLLRAWREWWLKKRGRTGFVLGFFRLFAFGILFLFALPIAGIAAVLLLALLFPILIPIQSLRDSAKAVALKLANTLGDSYILISSTTQFDAMVTRVAENLAWLAEQVKPGPIAIVAHSQGTAITYEVLKRHPLPKDLKLLVTHGEAIEKLVATRAIRSGQRYLRYFIAWLGVGAFYLAVIFVPRLIVELSRFGTRHGTWLGCYIGFAALGVVGLVFVFWFFVTQTRDRVTRDLDAIELPTSLRWVDMYASADPVPNGPMRSNNHILKFEVWNKASMLTDHTTYLAAPDDFVAGLAWRLAALDPRVAPRGRTERLLRLARWRRWWRTWCLSVMRMLAAAGAVGGIVSIGLRGHVRDIGNDLPDGLRNAIVDLLKPITSVVVVGKVSHSALAGGVVIAAVVLVGFAFLTGIWLWWESQDVKRFFRGSPGGARPPGERDGQLGFPLGGIAFGLFAAALLVMTSFSVEVAVYGNYPQSAHEFVHRWLWFLFVLLPAAWVVVASWGPNALAAEAKLREMFDVKDLLSNEETLTFATREQLREATQAPQPEPPHTAAAPAL